MRTTQDSAPGARLGPAIVMVRARFVEELARQRAYCAGRSPLYHRVLRALEEDAALSPAWLGEIEAAWSTRRFTAGWEAVHLLLACLHLWALRGQAQELAEVYPSCGGRSGADPGEAAVGFLRRAPALFWNELGPSRLQNNEVGRGVAWMLAAAAAFRPRGLPFHLVELGASAGLALIGDAFPVRCRFSGLDGPVEPPALWDGRFFPTLSRVGLDVEPRQLARSGDRLWIKACVWADDAERLARLDRAIERFLELETSSSSGPRLKRRHFTGMADWLGAKRPPAPGEGLLVFNAAATVFLQDVEYANLRRKMTRVLAPWGDRALWVECEPPRGVTGPHELTVHRLVDGRFDSRRLAVMDPRPREVRLMGGWESSCR